MRKNKQRKLDRSELSPAVAAGITESQEELEAQPKGKIPDGLKVAQHMNQEHDTGISRAPRPHFVGVDDPHGIVRKDETGRKMGDVNLIFTHEMMSALRSGMVCLKCLEPQEFAFEDHHLRSCEGVMVRGPRYMRDWQIVDIAVEFVGETHVGPQKPLAEYEEELEEKILKHQFDTKIASGKSPMKGIKYAA